MGRFSIPTGSGELRHAITLQQMTDNTSDAYGQPIKVYTDVRTVRAKVEFRTGAMGTDATQQKAERTGLITCRYFGPIDQTTQRFTFSGRLLNIVSVEDVEEKHEWYRIEYQELIGGASV